MVSPMDISQLLIAIPQIIDYSVKTIRLLRDYQKINGNLLFSLQRADDLLLSLRKYVIIVQCTALTDDVRSHLELVLQSARDYTEKLNAVLSAWKQRLLVHHQKDLKRSASDGKTSVEKLSGSSTGFSSSRPSLFKKSSCHRRCVLPFHHFILSINKMRYLAVGTISIHEALHKLESITKTLEIYLPISHHMEHLLSYNEAARAFTERAKEWKEPETCRISRNQLEMMKLEEGEDSIFFKVTERGEYDGCIVEQKDIMELKRAGQDELAITETERLVHMLREDKQAEDGITSTDIGILRCCGYIVPDIGTHELVFRKPKGFRALTLRKALTTPGSEMHRIEDRLELAIKLANAVHVFHSIGFVHKNIKPETVLIMQPPNKTDEYFYNLGTPYLAGFCASRYDELASGMYDFDRKLNKKLYHDPRQLGRNRPQKFQMRDDIYSLGVCLLEIGLWKSIFRWDKDRKIYVLDPWARHLFPDLPDDYDGRDDGADETRCDDEEYLVNYLTKMKLIRLVGTELRTKMNSAYCNAVLTCLTFGDKNGSAKFYSEVICKLRRALAA